MSQQPGPWGQPPQQQPPQQPPTQGWTPQHQPWAQGQPTQPSYGGPPPQPPKKSPALIIGIVVVAVVLIAAIGGIVMALGGRGGDEPTSTITPGPQSAPPTSEPTSEPSGSPTSEPSDEPTSDPSDPPSGGESYELDNGITLRVPDGWSAETTRSSYVVVQSDSGEIFEGQSVKLDEGSDPEKVVATWHQQLAKKMSDVEDGETNSVDVGASNLDVATGAMAGTIATSQGSLYVITESVASVRDDGVTVIATIRYFEDSDTDALSTDYKTMVNSMLDSQAKG